jgi:molybdenum cofactor cytidylyltransferase
VGDEPRKGGHRDDARVGGVVLAAGRSARMGRAKQLLPVGGRPLLQHAVDAARASVLREVVVVLGCGADEISPAVQLGRARVLHCADWAEGQNASLACGLHALGDDVDAAAILLGDQPGVDAQLIDRVLVAWRDTAEPALRPCFVDERGERVPGHPVLLAREVWGEVLASGEREDAGARAWLEANADRVRELQIDAPLPDDVDTWQDYQRAAERSGATRDWTGRE